jgi:hypothetical protein
MPFGDGTGPKGQGPGRGMNGGRGRMGGICLCPGCGVKIPHKAGIPCYDQVCPKCGTKMTRG